MTSLLDRTNLSAAILAIALTISGPPGLLAAPRALLKQDNAHLHAARDQARVVERLSPTKPLYLTLTLPLRNAAELEQLLHDLYDPSNPRYGSYLTSEEFAARFSPTLEDYRKLVDFAEARGMRVTQTAPNRTVLSVDASAQIAEQAFGVAETVYERADGTRFHAPDREPSLVDCPVEVLCVGGLDNAFPMRHAPITPVAPRSAAKTNGVVTNAATGKGGLSPADLRKAYDVPATATGAGVTLAVFQNTGYLPSDIAAYQSYYGTSVPLENVYFDSKTAANQGQSTETTLDIEMQIAMAPGAAKVITYIGDSGLSILNHIATDNRAQCVSISLLFDDGTNQALNQTLQQMAAQGQSVCCASGDFGAWAPGQDRPADLPYLTSVGGTSLYTGADGSWQLEPAWSGAGGGSSTLWPIPSYQRGLSMAANGGSTTMRNSPDVAIIADPYTGVSLYCNGAWSGIGGTSAAAPLWAGVAALIDQQRTANGLGLVGFLNPAVYAVGAGPYGAVDFHDIVTGNNANTNGSHAAVPGYDLVTGWGTPVVANLLTDLADGSATFDYRLTSPPLVVAQGGTGTSTLSVAFLNGASGTVSLAVGALPAGITASLSAASTATTSVLTLTASPTAPPGTFPPKVTGTSGGVAHVTYVPVTVEATTGAVTVVDLTSAFSVYAIYPDGATFTTGGFDGNYAFSSNLLGPSVSWSGVTFPLGPAGAPSAVAAGATVTLPAGSYNKIDLIASTSGGAAASQVFKVTYTNGTSVSFTQSMSDWADPSLASGESFAAGPLAHRNAKDGSQDASSHFYLYGYSFALDPTKTVKSITLPTRAQVDTFAMALVKAPTAATFSLATTPGSLAVARTGSVATTVSVGSTTGFTGNVALTASSLPAGVIASFSPASTNGTSVLTLTAGSTATLGSANVTVTGTSGSLTQSATVGITVRAAPVPVSLATGYNLQGIYTDGTTFTAGGFDYGGNAYSATSMGPAVTWNGIPFTLGTANSFNVVLGFGQKVTLPAGVYTTLGMLASATFGAQTAQTFRLNYTDGTSSVITQSLSDWTNPPQGYPGENVAMSFAYRDYKDGTLLPLQTYLYGYLLPVDRTRTVASIVLPNNNNVKILALTLVPAGTDAGSTPLSVAQTWRLSYFNNTSNTGSGADGADPDGDGISNLLERALGLDPTVPKVSGLPKLSVDAATGRLVLTATRGGSNATDLVFSAEASVDLVTWTTDNLTVLVNTATKYQVRDDGPAGPRRFLRLRVTQP